MTRGGRGVKKLEIWGHLWMVPYSNLNKSHLVDHCESLQSKRLFLGWEKRVTNLSNWYGLPSEHGLIDNTCPINQDRIAFHHIAPSSWQEQKVPWYQFFRWNCQSCQRKRITILLQCTCTEFSNTKCIKLVIFKV